MGKLLKSLKNGNWTMDNLKNRFY